MALTISRLERSATVKLMVGTRSAASAVFSPMIRTPAYLVKELEEPHADGLFLACNEFKGGLERASFIFEVPAAAACEFDKVLVDPDASIGEFVVHVSRLELVGRPCRIDEEMVLPRQCDRSSYRP